MGGEGPDPLVSSAEPARDSWSSIIAASSDGPPQLELSVLWAGCCATVPHAGIQRQADITVTHLWITLLHSLCMLHVRVQVQVYFRSYTLAGGVSNQALLTEPNSLHLLGHLVGSGPASQTRAAFTPTDIVSAQNCFISHSRTAALWIAMSRYLAGIQPARRA